MHISRERIKSNDFSQSATWITPPFIKLSPDGLLVQ